MAAYYDCPHKIMSELDSILQNTEAMTKMTQTTMTAMSKVASSLGQILVTAQLELMRTRALAKGQANLAKHIDVLKELDANGDKTMVRMMTKETAANIAETLAKAKVPFVELSSVAQDHLLDGINDFSIDDSKYGVMIPESGMPILEKALAQETFRQGLQSSVDEKVFNNIFNVPVTLKDGTQRVVGNEHNLIRWKSLSEQDFATLKHRIDELRKDPDVQNVTPIYGRNVNGTYNISFLPSAEKFARVVANEYAFSVTDKAKTTLEIQNRALYELRSRESITEQYLKDNHIGAIVGINQGIGNDFELDGHAIIFDEKGFHTEDNSIEIDNSEKNLSGNLKDTIDRQGMSSFIILSEEEAKAQDRFRIVKEKYEKQIASGDRPSISKETDEIEAKVAHKNHLREMILGRLDNPDDVKYTVSYDELTSFFSDSSAISRADFLETANEDRLEAMGAATAGITGVKDNEPIALTGMDTLDDVLGKARGESEQEKSSEKSRSSKAERDF